MVVKQFYIYCGCALFESFFVTLKCNCNRAINLQYRFAQLPFKMDILKLLLWKIIMVHYPWYQETMFPWFVMMATSYFIWVKFFVSSRWNVCELVTCQWMLNASKVGFLCIVSLISNQNCLYFFSLKANRKKWNQFQRFGLSIDQSNEGNCYYFILVLSYIITLLR